MKTSLLILTLGWITSLACPLIAADKPPGAMKLLHVVAFKFKPDASKEKIKEIEDAFRDLKKKIPQIKNYEWGTNISPEKHDKGFTHGFILTFESEAARDVYLDHADHKAFGAKLRPVLEDVFVIDYWARE